MPFITPPVAVPSLCVNKAIPNGTDGSPVKPEGQHFFFVIIPNLANKNTQTESGIDYI